jgi:hypothetical protein
MSTCGNCEMLRDQTDHIVKLESHLAQMQRTVERLAGERNTAQRQARALSEASSAAIEALGGD